MSSSRTGDDGPGVATPPTSVRQVPNQPATPKHGVRVPDERWEAAGTKARGDGHTLSSVINLLLEGYIRGDFVIRPAPKKKRGPATPER